ncbi:hypothetical protein HPB48_000285 [Haemaphysalis longicornis]|uniref:Serpin domain-containing protein n=1 Tax=Haemaphysalis longicornis TaxID=44386 RepID=A0A9J6GI24_HAELO|nr:hypothetical protein HPB48_000285 [Haemaphysalis longicornis]
MNRDRSKCTLPSGQVTCFYGVSREYFRRQKTKIAPFLRYLFWRTPAPPNRLREVLLNFSVELHKQQLLQQEGLSHENVLSAPFALALALTAAHAGSGQATAAQIAKALHLPEELIEEVRQEFTEMTHRLADCGPDFRIYIANAIFADRSVDVPENFSDLVETAYDGAVKQVDFRSDPNGARAAINAWVEEKTKCKVTDIIQSGRRCDHFTRPRTRPSMVEMMYQRKNYKTSCCDKLEVDALEMPFVGKKLSMVILRPQKVDGLDRLEKKLTPHLLENLLKSLGEDHDVEIYLPKFKLEHTSSFKGTLENPRSDGSVQRPKTAGVRVTAIEHKAVVEVDEDGVEGLFLTPLIMMCYAGVSFNYNVNRPFMFLIRSCDPDVILYIGSVRRL